MLKSHKVQLNAESHKVMLIKFGSMLKLNNVQLNSEIE